MSSAGREDQQPASTARRGSLPTEPEPVADPARAGAAISSSVFGDGEGDDPNSIQGRISRLDNIFAMLQILDSNDEVMLRRLENELMRLEANEMRQNTAELEREFDEQMQIPTRDPTSLEPSASRGLYDLLYSLSELSPSSEHDRHEHDHEHDDDHEEHEPSLQLMLPNGNPLTTAHIDVVSHALTNACQVLNLDIDPIQIDVVQERVRRLSNASEPDREQCEGEGEQIEGYEGDRAERSEHEQNQPVIEVASQVVDDRVARIIQILKTLHANGTGPEELDDIVLQSVLQLHAGPSTDNATASPDHLGNEQMQLYQDCIAAIDDFFELLTMINEDTDDQTDHEHRGTISADDAIEDEDDADEPDRHRSRAFSRGSN